MSNSASRLGLRLSSEYTAGSFDQICIKDLKCKQNLIPFQLKCCLINTYAEGISMRERCRLIGNAFHAGVMRHLLCCYISSVAMEGAVLRDDVRQSVVPFTMNQYGPEGGPGMSPRRLQPDSGGCAFVIRFVSFGTPRLSPALLQGN